MRLHGLNEGREGEGGVEKGEENGLNRGRGGVVLIG